MGSEKQSALDLQLQEDLEDAAYMGTVHCYQHLDAAVAELSALRAENARMREAVLRLIDCIRCDPTMDGSVRPMGLRSRALVVESLDFARSALGGRDV